MQRLSRHHWPAFLLALALGPVAAQSQTGNSQYTPAVPAASISGGYGGYYGGGGHASTLEEGALNGMASVMSAAGDYNLATSAAAVNLTQAQRNDIENRQLNTQAYFEIRATNRAARAQEAGPKPTMEQLARLAKQGVPKGLQATQYNAVTGALSWPTTLTDDLFAAQRSSVDQMFAKLAAQGTLGISDQSALRAAVEGMAGVLKAHIKDIQPQDYVDSRNFLQSVLYAGTHRTL
jgi:hypothetical protein